MAILFRRREFLLVCGTTAATGFRVNAKQSEALRTIGILAQELQPGLLEAFTDELQKIGYVKGGNINIEVRDAFGQNNRLPVLAQELLNSKIEVIVAVNTACRASGEKNLPKCTCGHDARGRSGEVRTRDQPRQTGWQRHRVELHAGGSWAERGGTAS